MNQNTKFKYKTPNMGNGKIPYTTNYKGPGIIHKVALEVPVSALGETVNVWEALHKMLENAIKDNKMYIEDGEI